jgi:hypothetical protein
VDVQGELHQRPLSAPGSTPGVYQQHAEEVPALMWD